MWRNRPQIDADGVLASAAPSLRSPARTITDDLKGKAALGGAKPENSSLQHPRHSWLSLVGSDPKRSGGALRVDLDICAEQLGCVPGSRTRAALAKLRRSDMTATTLTPWDCNRSAAAAASVAVTADV